MRVPLTWLHDFVDVLLPAEELADVLTLGGLVVDAILRPGVEVHGVVVAEVASMAKIEGSDKLWLVTVSDGDGSAVDVVCGAANYAPGDKVAWARPGSVLPGGLEVGRKQLFGHTSNGMLASPRELAVGDDHAGIWVLDSDAPLGAELRDWLQLDDAVFELDLNPDRGYAQSMLGVARDVAALTGAQLRVPDEPPSPTGDPGVPVRILDTDRCRRFDARRIADVTIRPSPTWVQRRLAAAGMRPISNVVDATNYTMLEIGNPIHAYDRALLAGPRIDVRTAAASETLVTIDGVERDLNADDLVICDADGPVALAGLMGGAGSEINDGTTDVLLEVANFAPWTVSRSSRRHHLFTEGSTRWEKTVPPESAPLAAARCAERIVAWSGGQIVGGTDHYPAPRKRPVIHLRTGRARSRLGMDVSDRRQAELLRSIACEVEPAPVSATEEQDEAAWRVTPPAYRPDLTVEADLHEEIARLEGYDRIPERVPSSGRVGGRSPELQARRRVREGLACSGWREVAVGSFIARSDTVRLGLPEGDRRLDSVRLRNPLSAEQEVLRSTLLPGLLATLRFNLNRQAADLALFEVGRVFLRPDAEDPGAHGGPDQVTLPAEPDLLGLIACGDFVGARHDRAARAADIYDVLGAADLVRSLLGHPPLVAEPTDEMPYHPGRAARLRLGTTPVGVVGELHPRVIDAFEVPARTLAGELRLDRLIAAGLPPARPGAPSALPGLRFDVAVVVDDTVPAAAVAEAVSAGAGERLTSCILFDVYRGASIGDGNKSLAYRIRLDDTHHQLSDADEASAIGGIERAVAERVGGRLRR